MVTPNMVGRNLDTLNMVTPKLLGTLLHRHGTVVFNVGDRSKRIGERRKTWLVGTWIL